MTTIGALFDLTVKKYGDKEALFDCKTNKRYTYCQWQQEVNRLANALQVNGIRKGDVVSTFLFNREELATALFACAKIGAVFNPINFRLTQEELAYILEDFSPKVVLFEEGLAEVVSNVVERFPTIAFWFVDEGLPTFAVSYREQLSCASSNAISVEVDENDVYAVMYTSGTTGRPKGVLHHHRDMVEQSLILSHAMTYRPYDKGLVVAPLFHCAELHCCLIPRVHVGAANVIMPHFQPKQVLQIIEQERITKFFAAPTMWNMLLQENLDEYDLSSVVLGLYGAAPMAPALVERCREKLGVELIQAYGMTEMGPAITILLENDQVRKAGAAGQACLNHEIVIVAPNEEGPSDPSHLLSVGEAGEILVKGPCIMKGYYNKAEATEKALYKGWYHTGDIGYLDEEGYLWVLDRVDDMIISGGENVYPREVEDVLLESSAVLDVAVIGQPDEHWGEKVTAFVVTKEAITAEELDALCLNSGKLARYKRPRQYIFVEQLPRNASGKLQKFLLRSRLKAQP